MGGWVGGLTCGKQGGDLSLLIHIDMGEERGACLGRVFVVYPVHVCEEDDLGGWVGGWIGR